MLSREELREIAEIQPDSSCFVSLYLNVNPVTNAKGDYIIHLKNMLRDVSEGADRKVFKGIKSDLEKIESFVVGNKREFKKGLAVFSSSGNSFWKEYNLAVPVKNRIMVDKTPYIEPLLHILDNYQRYAALLVDREFARLFLIHLGEIEEYGDVHTSDVPGKHKRGGWFSLSGHRFERHIDYHVGLHLKDVIKKLGAFLSGENISRVVIGGAEDAVVKVREMLPGTVNEKVIGIFNAEMFAGINEVFERCKPVISCFEENKQKTTVSELMTMAMKRQNAVIGADDVLNALQEGRVMKLIFVKDFSASGYFCSNCRYLTTQRTSLCPYCNSKIENVNYLIDLAAQRAVENGALVEVISYSKGLLDAGGIGAFLRF